MSDGYLRQREFFENISGSVAVDISDTEPVLVPANLANSNGLQQTIFIQRAVITIQTPGAPGTTWTLGDDQAVFITPDYPVDADSPNEVTLDYTAIGRPLTEGASFILSCSQAGAGGIISWSGYRKLTGIGAI